MFLRFLGLVSAFFLTHSLAAQSLPTEEDLRTHIEILASDEFEGRQPGTVGEALTVNYIAAQFAQAGILPGYQGNYYQPVALISRSDARATLSRSGNARIDSAQSELIALGNREQVTLGDLPVVFVGHGLEADNSEPDAGSENRFDGRAILLLRGSPEAIADPPSFRTRLAYYRDRGAAAVLAVALPDTPWSASQNSLRFRQTYLASQSRAPVEAILSAAALNELMSGTDYSYSSLASAGASQSVVRMALGETIDLAVATVIDRFDGINVVGRIAGSGDTGEAVLFTAHHDHFGICRPDDPDNQVCNGAVDNASGTAAIIEIARALATGEPPVRDIVFVTTTAEEDGLLGAIAFAEAPPIELSDIVAVFNLDTIAIAPAGAAVGIIGRGMTPLDPLIDEVARELGRAVDTELSVNAFVRRNDAWAFLRLGVPAVMTGGSFTDPELLNGFLSGRYHRNIDEVDGIVLGGAVEDTVLHIGLGRAFSDPERYPTPER